jgi:putative oxidoreductase
MRETMRDLGLFLVRLMPAVVMIYHGAQKLFGWFGGSGMTGENGFIAGVTAMNFPLPTVAAWSAACTEFVGGIFLLLGILPRLASILLALTMFIAAIYVKLIFADAGFDSRNSGAEYPMVLAFVFLGLVFTGAGRWTLQHALLGRKAKPDAD